MEATTSSGCNVANRLRKIVVASSSAICKMERWSVSNKTVNHTSLLLDFRSSPADFATFLFADFQAKSHNFLAYRILEDANHFLPPGLLGTLLPLEQCLDFLHVRFETREAFFKFVWLAVLHGSVLSRNS